MTTGPFSVGSVHVDVDVDATATKQKIERALSGAKANIKVDVLKADLDAAKAKIKQGLSGVTANVSLDVDMKKARAQIEAAAKKGRITVPVTARITEVIKPSKNPVINVTARITRTVGGGSIGGGGRGGGGGESEGFLTGKFMPARILKALKGAGSGGFFEGITTAIAHVVELFQLPGRIIGGMLRVAEKAFKKIGDWFETFGKWISTVSDQLVGLGEKFAALGGMIGKLGGALGTLSGPVGWIVQIVGALLALSAIAAAITTVAPLLANLAGIVTLLGGALANTAAAAAIFAPLLVSLGVGAGVAFFAAKDAASAFGAMTKAITSGDAKDLEAYNEALGKLGPNAAKAVRAAEPLVEIFKGLKGQMEERFFEGTANGVKGLKPLFDSLKKPILDISTAMGNMVDKFLQLGQNKTFVASVQTLFSSVAPIMDSLGTAFANTFAGLTNLFALLSPLAQQLGRDIANISAKFLGWTESEGSRKSIVTFFEKAYDIAKDVINIIGTLGQIFIQVFTDTQEPLGKNEGFLDKINAKLDQWLAWVQSPEGGETIKRWLDTAAGFAKLVWEQVENIATKFKEWLDDPNNQGKLDSIVGSLGNLATHLMTGITRLGEILTAMQTLFSWVPGGGLVLDLMKWIFLGEAPSPLDLVLDVIPGGRLAKSIFDWLFGEGPPVVQAQVKVNVEDWAKSVGGGNLATGNRMPGKQPGKLTPGPSVPYNPALGPRPGLAAGGLVSSPTRALIGEAGLEAVIPLARPLGQVDPSVRAMAALVRGEKTGKNPGAGIGASTGRTYNVTQNIQLSQADPEAAAASVVNRLMSSAMR